MCCKYVICQMNSAHSSDNCTVSLSLYWIYEHRPPPCGKAAAQCPVTLYTSLFFSCLKLKRCSFVWLRLRETAHFITGNAFWVKWTYTYLCRPRISKASKVVYDCLASHHWAVISRLLRTLVDGLVAVGYEDIRKCFIMTNKELLSYFL